MISEREAAKYPFLRDAVSLVEVLDVTLDDLVDPSYGKVLDRAEDRVSQAIQVRIKMRKSDVLVIVSIGFMISWLNRLNQLNWLNQLPLDGVYTERSEVLGMTIG